MPLTVLTMTWQEGCTESLDPDKVSVKELSKHLPLSNRVRQWKPPEEFKDWNDVVLGKPYIQKNQQNKFQRDAAMAERRKRLKQ